MSQNMLVERLKFAKRELTALKTAHTRGFGLLKIYKETLYFSDLGIEEGDIYSDATLTIKFSRDFPPNPFVYTLGDVNVVSVFTGELASFIVSTSSTADNGYTTILKGTAIYYITQRLTFEKIEIFSTAPITSLNLTV